MEISQRVSQLKIATMALLLAITAAAVSTSAQADDQAQNANLCSGVFRGSTSNGDVLKLTFVPNSSNGLRVRMVVNRDPAEYGNGFCQADGNGSARFGFDVNAFNAHGWSNGSELRGRAMSGEAFDLFREN